MGNQEHESDQEHNEQEQDNEHEDDDSFEVTVSVLLPTEWYWVSRKKRITNISKNGANKT